jgi:capsular polysaccharide transport system permease protein
MGERLVNNLNDRSRQDLIEVAARDVADAEERAKVAAAALSQFRSKGSLVDPGSQSVLQLTSVAKMQEDLLAAEAQLAQIRQVSPSNPQIPSLESAVKGLRRAIESETGKVTSGSNSLMGKTPVFDRLMLEKGFAERQLAGALAALDSARGDAQRKQLYLERLVQPNLPDKAMEPRRLRSVLTVFVLGLIAWGIVSLVFSSVREHTD